MRPAVFALLLVACSSANPDASSSESAEAVGSATAPVVNLAPPNTTLGIEGALEAAERALPGALAGEEAKAIAACGARTAHPFVRFDDGTPHPTGPVPPRCGGDVDCLAAFVDAQGCTATLFQETFDRGTDKREIDVECPRAWCAGEPLDDLEIVELDADAVRRGTLQTVSGARPGAKLVLDVDLAAIAAFVEDAHTIAVAPHLFARFADGAFAEIPALPSLPHGRGVVFDDAPLASYTAVLTVPAGATRVELYVRLERWHYTREIVHDAPDKIHLKDRTSDGFVSNFGNNFILGLR